MTPYEQKLEALGITSRGQLAGGFADEMPPSSKAPKQAAHKGKAPKPPLAEEDFTHLKGSVTGEKNRQQWKLRNPQQRARAAGWSKEQGKARRLKGEGC